MPRLFFRAALAALPLLQHRLPPLLGSTRVLGSKEVVTRIVLHGLTGKVDGKVYERPALPCARRRPSMQQDDRIVAGLPTYIRNSRGNKHR